MESAGPPLEQRWAWVLTDLVAYPHRIDTDRTRHRARQVVKVAREEAHEECPLKVDQLAVAEALLWALQHEEAVGEERSLVSHPQSCYRQDSVRACEL